MSEPAQTDRVLTIPNVISFLRIASIPAFVALIVVRDVAVLTAGLVLLSRRRARIEVRYLGKVATFGLMTAIACIAWGNLGYPLAPAALACGWAFYAAGIVEYYVAALLYVGDLRRAWRGTTDRAVDPAT